MLCVIAKTDEQAAEKLTALRDMATSLGIAPRRVYGHITLVTYIGEDEATFVADCKAALCGLRAFPVVYDAVEVLSATSIIVASPQKSGALDEVQKRLSEGKDDCLDFWTQRDNWRPHTTLVYRPGVDLEDIAREMRARFDPFSTQITRLEFSRVMENGYEIVDTLELPD